jgi:hypothetical protein
MKILRHILKSPGEDVNNVNLVKKINVIGSLLAIPFIDKERLKGMPIGYNLVALFRKMRIRKNVSYELVRSIKKIKFKIKRNKFSEFNGTPLPEGRDLEKEGYCYIYGEDVNPLLAACSSIVNEKNYLKIPSPVAEKFHNPNILRKDDFKKYPEILKFAMNEKILKIVSDYLGMSPQITQIQLWLTPPNDTLISSQVFHIDSDDMKIVKLFVNCNDVDSDSGPFTFYSKPDTKKFKEFHSIDYHDRYPDEFVERVLSSESSKEFLDKGSAILVDTANCLHFGGRGNKKERLVFNVTYHPVPVVLEPAGHMPDIPACLLNSQQFLLFDKNQIS